MRYVCYILIVLSVLSSETIYIPTDYPTIQEGINIAVDGDTVLVEPGTYNENLILEKSIVLASRAIFDDLSDGWITVDEDSLYQVANTNIANTILDGYNPDDPQSVILINSPPDNPCIAPEIFGFTITDGSGTIVVVDDEEQVMGGGIFINNALPTINYNFIKDCNCDNRGCSIRSGGGVQQSTGANFPTLIDIEVSQHRCEGDLDYSNNMFYNNEADYGSTFDSDVFTGYIDMTGSYFDVYAEDEEDVSDYWVNTDDNLDDIDLEGGYGFKGAITQDVWVSPNGDDTNSGLSSDDAFLTIGYALSKIYVTEDNPITINLTSGEFSPDSTGESFPIIMMPNINLVGEDEETTILDAQQLSNIIIMENCDNNIISYITITGGLENRGGGVYLAYSNPTLTNITISGNQSLWYGSGMYLLSSNPILTDVTISGNSSADETTWGGGMYLLNSNPILTDVIISENTATYIAGGMHLSYSNPILTDVTISENTSNYLGGGMYISNSNPILTRVTINGNSAEELAPSHTNDRWGGGIYSVDSDLQLTDVMISGNTSLYTGGGIATVTCNLVLNNVTIVNNVSGSGGGIYTLSSDFMLNNVTIVNNVSSSGGGGMHALYSYGAITNSILWDNNPGSFYTSYGNQLTYSDIDTYYFGALDYWADGCPNQFYCGSSINEDPLFTNSNNDDYTLIEGSPCIDSGNPDLWYQDLDGTQSDMGATGGLYLLLNFTSHDFGEVGDINHTKSFTLYNYRETPVTINTVNFNTSSFTTNTLFPITIEPLETGIITIEANNNSSGYVADNMEIISEDLPTGISVGLEITGVESNVLSGEMTGTYTAADYHIIDDLTIAEGDTVYLEAGTKFLFDDEINFNIYGTIKAIGTENDSIIFDNFDDGKWAGFTIDGVSDETEFRYVRISGIEDPHGPMHLISSNPTLSHVTISGNTSYQTQTDGLVYISGHGGGMKLHYSNPTLTHVTISGNIAEENGGGIYVRDSAPILNYVTISGNIAGPKGGGIYFRDSTPILNYVTISENTAEQGGGINAGYVNTGSSSFSHNLTIVNNIATSEGGGIYGQINHIQFINSILWGNSPDSYAHSGGSQHFHLTYSNIEGGWAGEGNIADDPLFTNPDNDDYSLQEGSPCIDAGTADIDGDGVDDITDYVGLAPDMGAYEYGDADDILIGDLCIDGILNILDVVQLIHHILGTEGIDFNEEQLIAADINSDGIINVLDVITLVNIIIEG